MYRHHPTLHVDEVSHSSRLRAVQPVEVEGVGVYRLLLRLIYIGALENLDGEAILRHFAHEPGCLSA